MTVFGDDVLQAFTLKHADAKSQVNAWLAEAEDAEWSSPAFIRARFPSASIIDAKRVVFRLKGTKYRMVVTISYEFQIVIVDWAGTHGEYDKLKL